MSEVSKKKPKAKKASKKKATQAKKRVAKASGKARATPKKKKTLTVSAEQRAHMIREAAYFRAMNRGFQGGSSEQDWIEAELEIARQLQE